MIVFENASIISNYKILFEVASVVTVKTSVSKLQVTHVATTYLDFYGRSYYFRAFRSGRRFRVNDCDASPSLREVSDVEHHDDNYTNRHCKTAHALRCFS